MKQNETKNGYIRISIFIIPYYNSNTNHDDDDDDAFAPYT
jgi:hypothetical protein